MMHKRSVCIHKKYHNPPPNHRQSAYPDVLMHQLTQRYVNLHPVPDKYPVPPPQGFSLPAIQNNPWKGLLLRIQFQYFRIVLDIFRSPDQKYHNVPFSAPPSYFHKIFRFLRVSYPVGKKSIWLPQSQ